MRKLKRPKKMQRRDDPSKVQQLAAVLFKLAHFVLIVLEILKLWNELTG